MERLKKHQLIVGKVVTSLIEVSKRHPDIWKDEHWDSTMKLVESIAELIAFSAGASENSDKVLEHIMKKLGRSK